MLTHIFNKKTFFLSLLTTVTLAEYRVYQYMVSPRFQRRTPSSIIVTSTLDPSSYVSYHGGQEALRINLLKTWTCKGHTGGKSVCDDPMAKLLLDETQKEAN